MRNNTGQRQKNDYDREDEDVLITVEGTMARKKKETLVHLDLETLSKETTKKTSKNAEETDTSLGGTLRRAREKKKLSINQIAKKLCIRDIYLEALENGHYYVFPGLAYGIGFLRTYARFLELDAGEMVEKFHAETSSIQEEPLEMPIPKNVTLMPSGRTIFKGLAVVVILYLVWYIGTNLMRSEPVTIPQTPQAIVTEEIAEINSEAKEPETPTNEGEQAAEIPSETINEPKETNTALDSADLPPVTSAPIIADTVTKPVQPVQMKKAGFGDKLWSKLTPAKVYGTKQIGALSFVATEEVWVKVMQGERVILEEILYKGDRYNVPAVQDLTLTTANAGALTVYVNGKKKKTLGAKGSLVEGIVLNPENFN